VKGGNEREGKKTTGDPISRVGRMCDGQQFSMGRKEKKKKKNGKKKKRKRGVKCCRSRFLLYFSHPRLG